MRSVLGQRVIRSVRAISTAGMRHTARRLIQPTMELPDEEVEPVGGPTYGPPICCLLTETEWTDAEIAASNGAKTKWLFRPPQGAVIPIGSQWQVTDDCEAWTETVEITGHVKKHGRVLRLFAAVDVLLDQ